jgi:hypothetical protein
MECVAWNSPRDALAVQPYRKSDCGKPELGAGTQTTF